MKTCLTVFTDHLKRLNNLSAVFRDHFAPRWNDLAAQKNHFAAPRNHFAPFRNDFASPGNHFTARGNDFAPLRNDLAPSGNHFAPHGNDFALCRNHFFAGRRSSGVLHNGLCQVQDSENKALFTINLNQNVV